MPHAMLQQLLAGGGASLINLIIHAVMLAIVVRTVRDLSRSSDAPRILQDVIVIVATGLLLVATHFLEVLVWAMTYAAVGAAPPGTDLIYFAFGNYTTLSTGDVVPDPQWRLLGPMTALNGILLIGWSTALVFAILRRSVSTAPAQKR